MHGRRTALLDGERAVTFNEFYNRVLRCGQALKALGVARGDRVAVLMLNSPSYLELYFGIASIGAAIVPVNTRWSTADIDFSIRDSGAMVFVTDDHFDHVVCDAIEERINPARYQQMVASAEAIAEPDVEEDSLAGLFYTSGTTGGPKGVILTHRNIFAHALMMIAELGINETWVYLNAAPMFHLANGALMFAVVFKAATSVFQPAFDPEATLRIIEKHRVTASVMVPTMWNAIINHPRINSYDTSSFQNALYGASPMPVDLLRRCVEHFGPIFIQAYGMTETSPVMTMLMKNEHVFENLDQKFTPVKSAGRPVMSVEVRIFDDNDIELPQGETGEIVMRGPTRMKGYWNRPEANAEVLRNGWMHTGDLGAIDENGFVYILDRKKDMIKSGGENVFSPEVENVLMAHPAIMEAVVFGVPDSKWGETIKAAVVLRDGQQATGEEIIRHCRAKLTHFKCPTSVDFHSVLPKGGTGKIQKNVLRQPYWQGKERGVN